MDKKRETISEVKTYKCPTCGTEWRCPEPGPYHFPCCDPRDVNGKSLKSKETLVKETNGEKKEMREMSYEDCDKYIDPNNPDCYHCTAQEFCAFWQRFAAIFNRCKRCGNLMPDDKLSSLLPLCPDCENIETTLEMEQRKSIIELERESREPLR